jgi:tetratricopeptide (TPR) repeat protein
MAGLDLLQSALESLRAEQYQVLITTFMGAIAEGLLKTGQFEEALSTADRAIALSTSSGIRFNIPELLRVKSEILVAKHDREAARVCLTEAIAIARSQSSLALELRSAMGLACLLSEEGLRERARTELALVYGRFVEGFETSDLKQARLLMEKLNQGSSRNLRRRDP